VDNIIFGATNDSLYDDFSNLMQVEFDMSMMGELKFFLRLQIKQTNEGIYIHQTKYVKELLKKFKMDDAKQRKTPMYPTTILRLDEESKNVDEKTYRRMIGSLLYLTCRSNFMMMNQAILMMLKAQVIDSRSSIKNPIQDSRFKRRNQEATSQDFI